MEQFKSKYFRGQGAMFLADRDASGNAINALFIGNCSSAGLTANVERGEKVESVTGGGATDASFIKRVSYTLALEMDSIRKDHLKMQLQGTLTDKVGASVTDEPHVGYHDGFVLLDHTKVSTVVVTDSAGTTTYTEGAANDYVLKGDQGMIEILAGGSIADVQALLIDYVYAAQAHVSASASNLEKYLVFAGMNSADNDKQTRVEVYKVKLDPSVMDLITDDTASATINGTVQLDSLRAVGDQLFSWKVEE